MKLLISVILATWVLLVTGTLRSFGDFVCLSSAHAADFLGANVEDLEAPVSAGRLGIKGIMATVTRVPNNSLASKIGLSTGDAVFKVGESLADSSLNLAKQIKSTNTLTVYRSFYLVTLSLSVAQLSAQPDKNDKVANKLSELPTRPILRIETSMHSAPIRRIDIDKSGHWLVTASDDKTVRVWDVFDLVAKQNRLEQNINPTLIIRPPIGEDQEGQLGAVAISPNGEFIATGGKTGTLETGASIYIFSRSKGNLLGQVEGIPSTIQSLALSADGRLLAVTLGVGGMRLFAVGSINNASRQLQLRLIAEDREYGDLSGGSHFSPDGLMLVTSCRDGFVRLYDVTNIGAKSFHKLKPIAKQMTLAGKHGPYSVKFSPDGHKIAIGFVAPEVQILSVNNLNLIHKLYTSDTKEGSFSEVGWSHNGRTLYAAGSYHQIIGGAERTSIRSWTEAEPNEYIDFKSVADNTIFGLAPLSDGSLIFASGDTTIGVLGKDGLPKASTLAAVTNFSDDRMDFQLSHDGAIAKFEYGDSNRSHTIFSLVSRELTLKPQILAFKLKPPNTTALDIRDWKHSHSPILNDLQLKLKTFEKSHSLAIAEDNRSFLLGTEWNIHRFDVRGNLQWSEPIPSTAWVVNIAQNGKVAVAALGDGTIRWYDYATGRELLAFFPHADKKRWVLWTPEGFFDHSPGGEELIGWHLNQGKDKEALFFRASKLYKEFYRPDLVTASFEGKDLSAYAKAIDINKLLSLETIPPTVHFLTKSGRSDNYDIPIRAQICNTGGGIGDMTLFLNGMPVAVETAGRGLTMVEKNSDGQCYFFERTITLSQGANSIQLMAYNKANTIESHRDTIDINHTAKAAQPELHVLTVAVNAYRDGDLRLKYALPDADALTEQVQVKGKGIFDKIHIHTLRDGDVTKEGLTQIFSRIGSIMKREDVFLLFVAGHGITDEKEGAYYFLPADFRYTGEGAVQKQAVSMTDFRNMLANVQAMKSLILLDTCNSGSFAEAIASRGMTEKTAITKLSRAVGRATIVASSKSQVALEGYEGHGAFTWTIIEGMKGKAADKGGKITINSLATYIEEELPKLTYKKWGYEQVPQKTLQGMDFQIGVR